MEYTVIINGRSYDLPKKNITVAEKLDEVLKVDAQPGLSARQKFDKLHRFVKDIIGAENAKEIFGSDKLEELDLSELSLLVLKIEESYNRPLVEYQTNKMLDKMSSIPTDQIASIGKSVQMLSSMQGNNK